MGDGKQNKPPACRARRNPNEGAPPRPPAALSTPAQRSHVNAAEPPPPRQADVPKNEPRGSPASSTSAGIPSNVPGAPLLMLPESAGGTVRMLYDLSRGRGAYVNLPEMEHHLCYAASHGWVMAGNCFTGECFLLDPLSRARRDLPRLTLCTRTPHAALSSAPTDPGCVAAVAFPGSLVLCRLGASSWSVQRLEGYEHDPWLGDCAFCRGALFLMCGGGGSLFVVDSAGREGVRRVQMDVAQLPPQAPGSRRLGFLVESLGQLLLVVATEVKGTLTCGVFRADLEKAAWAAVEGFGDRALFVGKGCSGSVAAGEAGGGGVRAGRVYISHPLLLVDEESRRRVSVEGRWFWAEHVMGLGFPAMKRTPPLRGYWDICWDASYWLIPNTRVSSSPSTSRPPPSPRPPPPPRGVQL